MVDFKNTINVVSDLNLGGGVQVTPASTGSSTTISAADLGEHATTGFRGRTYEQYSGQTYDQYSRQTREQYSGQTYEEYTAAAGANSSGSSSSVATSSTPSPLTVYQVKDCKLTIGSSYPVASFRLNISENSIPSITVGFDCRTVAGSSKSMVGVMTPELYFELYEQAQAWCDNQTEASFSFSIVNVPTGEVETITLSNWICSISGFSRFSANGGLVFGITLKHPAVKMAQSASNLTNVTAIQMAKLAPNITSANPVTALDDYMREYLKTSTTDSFAGTGHGLATELIELHAHYSTMLNAFPSVFKTDALGFPGGSDTAEALRLSIYSYAASLLTNRNPFSFITGTFLPEWFLSAKPQYNGPFNVSAFEPWGPPKYAITLHNVSDFNFPATENDPLMGVCMVGFWTDIGKFGSMGSHRDSVILSTMSDAVARLNTQSANPAGGIIRVNPPRWAIDYATSKTLTSVTKKGETVITNANQSYSPEEGAGAGVEINKEEFQKYKSLLQKIVDDTFLSFYKSTVSIAVTTRLMLKIGGEDLLPGHVCDITTSSAGLRFYITDIVHSVDVKGQQAKTEILGRYVRRPEATSIDGKSVVTSQLYTE